ncbi:MAG: hypothetical protein WC184_06030 [Acidimicrobiia bacterium]
MVAITQSQDFQVRHFSNVSTPAAPASPAAATTAPGATPELVSRAAIVAASVMVVAALLLAGLIGVYGGRLVDANRGIPQVVQVGVQGD